MTWDLIKPRGLGPVSLSGQLLEQFRLVTFLICCKDYICSFEQSFVVLFLQHPGHMLYLWCDRVSRTVTVYVVACNALCPLVFLCLGVPIPGGGSGRIVYL